MKWPSDILQNLPYIWNYIKQHSFFPFFISSYFIFYLVSAFTFQKYGKFWSVSQGQFSEHKPYFWRRVISICLIWYFSPFSGKHFFVVVLYLKRFSLKKRSVELKWIIQDCNLQFFKTLHRLVEDARGNNA